MGRGGGGVEGRREKGGQKAAKDIKINTERKCKEFSMVIGASKVFNVLIDKVEGVP